LGFVANEKSLIMAQGIKRFVLIITMAVGLVMVVSFALWVYYSPNPHEVSEYARTKWSKSFREAGLADVPKGAEYTAGPWNDGEFGYWSFQGDTRIIQQWLSDSKCINTAEVMSRSNSKGYLMWRPSPYNASMVVMHTDAQEEWVVVSVQISNTVGVNGRADRKGIGVEEARKVLSHRLDNNGIWNWEPR
jgi:hypothetical protein